MLRFDVYHDGKVSERIDLSGAYMFGQDYIPVRADLAAAKGQITCVKHVPGPCGVALLWDAGEAGTYLLCTTRLPEATRPYNLNVELARGQLMRIAQKREDWGLFDYKGAEAINEEFSALSRQFTESLKACDPAKAAVQADKTLDMGITLGEKIALFHADIFLERRKIPPNPDERRFFGCAANLAATSNSYHDQLRDVFDFVSIPIEWKQIEPKERLYEYNVIDSWINWAVRAKKPIHAGPLVDFDPEHLPQWLHIWENDFEALRDTIYEHIQQTVRRYSRQVKVWNVVSGLHAHNSFNLNFEQLMELTRMACLLVKKLVPHSQVMIELTLPWGEYYARNQQTIPPALYADMAVQSGIKFDVFGVRVLMGSGGDGYYVRDLLQISSLLDEFITIGKPLHITACQVPSGDQGRQSVGRWHAPWSQLLQAEWLQAFFRIGLSKPFVASICWPDLVDCGAHLIPSGGLCFDTMKPKLACKEFRNFRRKIYSNGSKQNNHQDSEK